MSVRTVDAPQAAAEPSRDQLIEEHLPLVRYVVGRMSASFLNGVMDTEDAYGYGITGLIQAIDKFDANRGVAFTTFAMQRIRGAIIDAAREMDLLPRSVRRNLREVDAANMELANLLGRWPTVKEVALRTGMPINQVQTLMRQRGTRVLSLDQPPQHDDTAEWEIADEDESIDPQSVTDRKAMSKLLGETLNGLPDREREILHLRYNKGLPFHSIAEKLRISESRASQLHGRIVRNLRKRLERAAA